MQINKEKFKKNKKILIPIISVISLFAILCVSLVVGSKDSLRNSEYQEKISSLNTQNINLHQNIVELNSQVSDLSKQLEIIIASNNAYQDTINNQASNIEELSVRLDAYRTYSVKELAFKINGKIQLVKLYEKGFVYDDLDWPGDESFILPDGYTIHGWSLDGETLISPTNFVINDNITLIAILEEYSGDIPDHNDTDEDRREENPDDGFWPE